MLAITVFLGAFLLFLMQPMAARMLLPNFGGAASVWTVCLLFFQAALVIGYAWAHYCSRRAHLALLVLSVMTVLAAPEPSADPAGSPSLDILRILTFTIGLPYVVLSANSPLMQRLTTSAAPYRLYAVSNAASLLALLAYPFAVEPLATLTGQWAGWRVLFALFCPLCALAIWRGADRPRAAEHPPRIDPFWIALPAAGTAALMATTNQMCQEIASVPFLWVVPLSLYLLSFVIAFDHPRWYLRRAVSLLVAIAVPLGCVMFVAGANAAALRVQLLLYAVTLLLCVVLCHGELAARKPETSSLTRYYLSIAVGGAMGGALVTFAAPRLFRSYAEYPIALGLCAGLGLLAQVRSTGYAKLDPLHRASYIGLMLAALLPVPVLNLRADHVVEARRNFYGVLRVTDADGKRTLSHGATIHGMQFLDPSRSRTPTTYYGWNSAPGRAIEEHHKRATGPLRAGFIGLGTGTLARYGRPGDQFTFYEINPDVIALARSRFRFVADSQAEVRIVEGDARLQLANEPPQSYDILVIDAFSSDSIPVHLLTAECSAVYKRHLAPGGRLLFHISNRTLDLDPVVRAIARHLNWSVETVNSPSDRAQGVFSATWMVLDSSRPYSGNSPTQLWTDHFAPLWSVLK